MAIAFDGQLFGRSALKVALGFDLGECGSCPDGQLVIAAYQKWGEDCPRALSGEFAFAIWDSGRQRLFCCRDHMGLRRLYYWSSGLRFRFGDAPLTILKNSSDVDHQLNRRKLAAMAIVSGQDFFDEETFYAGIMALPPGTTLTFDRNGLRKRTYWKPEIKPDLVPDKDDEAFGILRELVFRAVENRLEGSRHTATRLSGGLDSSAITAIAAKSLEKSNRALVAISAIVPEESRAEFEDERSWVEEFRQWPNLRMEFVTAAGRGPFDSILEARNFEDNFMRGSTAYHSDAMDDCAMACGVDLVLTGHGGEFGFTSRGDGFILELFARLQFAAAAKLLRELRKSTGVSPLRSIASDLLNTLFPLRRTRPQVYLAPSFRRECEAKAMVASQHWTDHRKVQRAVIESYQRMHARVDRFRPGQPLRHASPLFDRDLIEFCLAAPGHMKVRCGYRRYLVRETLKGLVPERNRWRTSGFRFSPDYPRRYAAQIGVAREFMTSIGPRDPVRTIVDVDRLGRMVALRESPGIWDAWVAIPVSIYLICFLRQFAEFRP